MNEYSKKEPLLNRTAAVSNVQTNQNVLMFDKDSYNGKGAEQRSYFNADRSELHTNNTGALAMERNNYNSNNNYGNNYANQNGYYATVAFGAQNAIDIIESYIKCR